MASNVVSSASRKGSSGQEVSVFLTAVPGIPGSAERPFGTLSVLVVELVLLLCLFHGLVLGLCL